MDCLNGQQSLQSFIQKCGEQPEVAHVDIIQKLLQVLHDLSDVLFKGNFSIFSPSL